LFEIYRLKGAYETVKEREARIDKLIKQGITEGNKVIDGNKLHTLLLGMNNATYQWSYPIEWGFAGLISACDRPTPPNLYMMSDNMDEEGDVHNGPYSTKNFVMWLKEMDVGDIHEVPARNSHRGGNHPIQVWVWHPDWPKCREVVQQCYDLAKEYHKEIENVEEKIVQVRKDRNAQYLSTFSSAAGW
jgi:hypothetical protein